MQFSSRSNTCIRTWLFSHFFYKFHTSNFSIIPAVAKEFEKIIYDQFFGYPNDNDLLAVNVGLDHFIAL